MRIFRAGCGSGGGARQRRQRLHQTGPEFDGWLSNHGPMAAEALVRHGHDDLVTSWLDGYMLRLEKFPRGTGPIGADWQQALGDPRRVADWTVFFGSELGEQPWRAVLSAWWPRLLPGVVAAATHGVIRVGHAIRVLLADGAGGDDSASDGADVRIAGLPGWPQTLSGFTVPAEPEQIRAMLAGLADAATCRYLYYPGRRARRRACHQFADAAVDIFARTGNPDAISAALRATALIEP